MMLRKWHLTPETLYEPDDVSHRSESASMTLNQFTPYRLANSAGDLVDFGGLTCTRRLASARTDETLRGACDMKSNSFKASLAGAVVFTLIPAVLYAAAASTAAGTYKAPTNAYGQPNLEGTWTNATLTIERPKEYGTRKVMTPAEVKKVKATTQNCMRRTLRYRISIFKTADLPHDCGKRFTTAPDAATTPRG